MDDDGDYDDYIPFSNSGKSKSDKSKSGKSKSGRSSDKYSSLLNQEDGNIVAQVTNKAGDRIGKQYVAWSLLAVILPLVI